MQTSPVEPLGRHGYLYSESRSEYGSHHMHPDPERVWVTTQTVHRETWRGWDDSGLIREQAGPPRFFAPEGQRRWEADGSPPLLGGLHQTVMAPGCMQFRRSQERVARLPTAPAALRAAIKREPRGDRLPAEEEFATIKSLLRTPEVPVELCKALYEVVCDLSVVVEVGEVLDHADRPGQGVEAALGGYIHLLVFDPDSRALLGEQETLASPDFEYAPVGTVTGWAVYLTEERVAGLPDDAPSNPGPPCLPGGSSIMREVQPGLTHATG